MGIKREFKPVVSRVKLNPEQAVLQCACWSVNQGSTSATHKQDTVNLIAEACIGKTVYSNVSQCTATGNPAGLSFRWAHGNLSS